MLRWNAAAMLGLVSLIAAGPFASRATPDAVLASNYGAALAETETSWSSVPHNIWLSRLGGGGSGPDKILAAGDTITITARDGHPQVIEVTGLERVDGDLIGLPGVRFQMVTGRVEGGSAAPVRFLFAIESPQHQSPLPAPAARVL